MVVSAQYPLEKISCVEAKARAPNLKREMLTLRKGISQWDEGLPEELLCAVSGETLVTDQCVVQAVTRMSQSRALSQASEWSQERGTVLVGAGWRMGLAGSADMN